VVGGNGNSGAAAVRVGVTAQCLHCVRTGSRYGAKVFFVLHFAQQNAFLPSTVATYRKWEDSVTCIPTP
jgi:hypothetical protein